MQINGKLGNYLQDFSAHWRFGTGVAIIHHLMFLIYQIRNPWKENAFDYLDGAAFHLLNSISDLLVNRGGPYFLWLQQYEWIYRGWISWIAFMLISSAQWLILGAACASILTLLRKGQCKLLLKRDSLLKIAGAICAFYFIWYSWLFLYSYRYQIKRSGTKYEYCGVLNLQYGDAPQHYARRAAEDLARSKFYESCTTRIRAKLGAIAYPEEYPPYRHWLFFDGVEGSISWVHNFRGSVRFRDVNFRGWSEEHALPFKTMQMIDYEQARAIYAKHHCLVESTAFFDHDRDQLYLLIQYNDSEYGEQSIIF
jgi:hypothetical protein